MELLDLKLVSDENEKKIYRPFVEITMTEEF